ncbi:MAG: hypothetical protein AMQ22_01876 [Candidatus Methanofastidiosum methylothiophilum]|uniref:Uncharacterized protein n=1 Tax=Candidatus Methanofastidiosum methylothiophilum TaxID=1705564 RepID=A0A150ITJ5_9EURY|nr:MAG: hypothetical protein AMQ22_01876 [Candidatus Methanofastidiosum methylthiophilus]
MKDYDRPVKLDQFDDAYIMPIQRHFPIGKLFFEITNLNATAIDITMCVEGYQETKRDIRQEDFKTPRIAWVSSVTLPAHTENNDIYFEIKDDIIIQEIGFSGNVENTMVMNIFRENRNGESIWKEKIPITLLKKGLFPFHSPDGIINYNAYLVFEKSERLRFEIENKSDGSKQLDVFLKGREREPNNK